jgi:hypothetical protein
VVVDLVEVVLVLAVVIAVLAARVEAIAVPMVVVG